MAFNISSQKHFAYRNSHNLEDFQISENFVYIVTSNGVHEYKAHSSVFISLSLSFKPVSTFICNQMFFICSKQDLYYFRTDLKHLMKIEPLTLNFESGGRLVSIDSRKVRIVDLSFLQLDNSPGKAKNALLSSKMSLKHTTPDDHKLVKSKDGDKFIAECSFDSDNGICSAFAIYNGKIVLGFENGIIGWIQQDFNNLIIHINEIARIADPVVSIDIMSNFVFISTINKIFRFPMQDERLLTGQEARECLNNESLASNIENTPEILNVKEDAKVFTDFKCKKIVVFENLLVAQEEKKIAFFNTNLELITCSIFQLQIKTIKVITDKLFVGFDCGLLIDFDLKSIRKKILD